MRFYLDAKLKLSYPSLKKLIYFKEFNMNISSEANKSVKENNKTADICINKQNIFDTSRVKYSIDYVSKLAYENINYIIAGTFFLGVAGLRYYYNQPQEKQVIEVSTYLYTDNIFQSEPDFAIYTGNALDFNSLSYFQSITDYSVNGLFSSHESLENYLLNGEFSELSEYVSENFPEEINLRVIAEGFMKDINMNHPILDESSFKWQILSMLATLYRDPDANLLDDFSIIQNLQYQLASLSLTDEVRNEFYNDFINKVKSCIDSEDPGFSFRIDDNLYSEYLKTVMLLSSTIAKASSEEENTNNNATTWNALSLSTDIYDNETDYTTHPKLIIESIAEKTEESDIYDYPTFVSHSYENDLCKFSLKKTVSDASYYLEAYNFFMSHKSPSKNIYSLSKANQFVFIPALLLMGDKLIDNFCDIIEDTCEHTLDLLGIEHSSISIDVNSL